MRVIILFFPFFSEKFIDALRSNPTNPSLLEHMAICYAGRVIVTHILKKKVVCFLFSYFVVFVFNFYFFDYRLFFLFLALRTQESRLAKSKA